MQELKPFRTVGPLKKALNNGGRFYNFFSDSDDEAISRGELAKAAGVYTAGIRAFLYLQMSKQDLPEETQLGVVSMLEEKLRKSFEKKKPPFVLPSQVNANHKAGQAMIVTGYAREIGEQTMFSGFIIVPMLVGKAMIPMMIPIHTLYRVFELFDDEKMKKPSAIVGAPLKSPLEISTVMQFGGVLKELKSKTKEPPTHPVFMEAIYWTKR